MSKRDLWQVCALQNRPIICPKETYDTSKERPTHVFSVVLQLRAAATDSASICSAKETYSEPKRDSWHVKKRLMTRQKETQTRHSQDTGLFCRTYWCRGSGRSTLLCKRDLLLFCKRDLWHVKKKSKHVIPKILRLTAECCIKIRRQWQWSFLVIPKILRWQWSFPKILVSFAEHIDAEAVAAARCSAKETYCCSAKRDLFPRYCGWVLRPLPPYQYALHTRLILGQIKDVWHAKKKPTIRQKRPQTRLFRDTAVEGCCHCLCINMFCKSDLSYVKKRPITRQKETYHASKETYHTSKRDVSRVKKRRITHIHTPSTALEGCCHCLCINMLCKRDLSYVQKRPTARQKTTWIPSQQPH